MSDKILDDFYSKVAKAIRDERDSQELSQNELAEKANYWAEKEILTRNTIANIETGRQQIPLFVYIAIVNALNIGFEDLLPKNKIDKNNVKQKLSSSTVSKKLFKNFFEEQE